MKILLVGASGQLGHELLPRLAAVGEVLAPVRAALDLSCPVEVVSWLNQNRPDVIVNAAAFTDVDRAESAESEAMMVNAEAVAVMAGWAARHHAFLLHYSTDFVFDGHAGRPYREDDVTSPLNVYGRSKRAGELALEQSGASYVCLRIGTLYSTQGRNFVRAILARAAVRVVLDVVADQTGTPTAASDVADATVVVLMQVMASRRAGSFCSGLYHLSPEGEINRHEFATAIVAAARRHGMMLAVSELQAMSSADFPAPAPRPLFSCLDASRLKQAYGVALPPWETSLDKVVRAISMQAFQ